MDACENNLQENQLIPVTLCDGLVVEAVAYASGTLCLSSQAGCAMACPFCASGQRGLQRNLSLVEMWRQVEAARQHGFEPQRLTLSGVGEPLHNSAVFDFLAQAGHRRLGVSVTTTGGPLERFRELMAVTHNGVMLSLHAGTEETHRRLLPMAPSWEALWASVALWYNGASRRARRRFGFNFLLLEGVNDSLSEVEALIARLLPFPEATLHLLTLNPVPGSHYASPTEEQFTRIHDRLRRAGIHVRRSNRWRRQATGGCGTLYVRELDQLPPHKERTSKCLSR